MFSTFSSLGKLLEKTFITVFIERNYSLDVVWFENGFLSVCPIFTLHYINDYIFQNIRHLYEISFFLG